jgi:hypothetical protein
MKITKSSNAILRSNVPSSGRAYDRSIIPTSVFVKAAIGMFISVRTRQQLAVYRKQGHCIAANVNHPDFGAVEKGITIGGIRSEIGTYRQDTVTLHMFGEQGDVDDLMVVLDQVQRNKPDET